MYPSKKTDDFCETLLSVSTSEPTLTSSLKTCLVAILFFQEKMQSRDNLMVEGGPIYYTFTRQLTPNPKRKLNKMVLTENFYASAS